MFPKQADNKINKAMDNVRGRAVWRGRAEIGPSKVSGLEQQDGKPGMAERPWRTRG